MPSIVHVLSIALGVFVMLTVWVRGELASFVLAQTFDEPRPVIIGTLYICSYYPLGVVLGLIVQKLIMFVYPILSNLF